MREGIKYHVERGINSYFKQYKRYTVETPTGRYIFIPRGGKVLAVAHLDTVAGFGAVVRHAATPTTPTTPRHDPRPTPPHNPAMEHGDSKWGAWVRSINLDDRLGAWILLDYLPSLGINDFDILLTEGEECGRSTASEFVQDRANTYNWIFEFDRRGVESAVLYQYDNPDTRAMLYKYGIAVEHGSYSDISSMTNLGVIGINFSAGYNAEHTTDCYAYLCEVRSSVVKFVSFYKDLKDTPMPYTPPKWVSRWGDDYDYIGRYNNAWYKDDERGIADRELCVACGAERAETDSALCAGCMVGDPAQCWVCGQWYDPAELSDGICDTCNEDVNSEGDYR
jgi:hypothetical protein